MTLLVMQGFDDSVAETGVTQSGGTLNNATSRTGVGGSFFTASTGSLTIAFPASATTVVGFGFRCDIYGTGISWLQINEGATVHLSLRLDASNQVQLYRGDGTTLLATATSAMPPAASWFFLEVKSTIADAGGSVEIKVGGVVVLTYSGDTRNGGATGIPDRIRLTAANGSGGATTRYDDLYVLNTAGAAPYNDYLGDIVVRTLLPTGNGDSSQWVGSDGNSVDNYLLVDEVNSSMTDYVGSTTSGNRDLYAIGDIPAEHDVYATQTIAFIQASDGGAPPTVLPVAKGATGTVRTDAALPAPSTTALSYSAEIRTTDPDGNALTPARVNAMQVGVQIA